MEHKKAVSVEENIANGIKAVSKVLRTHEDVAGAMYREEVGYIDFVTAKKGTQQRNTPEVMGLRRFLRNTAKKLSA